MKTELLITLIREPGKENLPEMGRKYRDIHANLTRMQAYGHLPNVNMKFILKLGYGKEPQMDPDPKQLLLPLQDESKGGALVKFEGRQG